MGKLHCGCNLGMSRCEEVVVRGSCRVGFMVCMSFCVRQLRCIGIAVFGSSSVRCCGRGNYSLEELWCERVAVLGICGVRDVHGSCSV